MVVASFTDLDLVQVSAVNFKLVDRDSGCALATYVDVTDVDSLVKKVRSVLREG